MTNEALVEEILAKLGGKENVKGVQNCMTRLRFSVVAENKIDETGLKNLDGVLGLVHSRPNYYEVVVGPGKCRKCADICQAMGLAAAASADNEQEEWKANKAAVKSKQKQNALLGMLKTFGEIFVPLIPGVILAGLCAGLATLLAQTIPGCTKHPVWGVVFNLLQLVSSSFMAYLSAWAGYKAAERFGATPILGGMLGMITNLGGINAVSSLIGLFDTTSPLNSVLRSGRGGVLAAIVGVWFLAKVEKKIRSKMPDNLDIIFTPLLAMIICVVPYVLVVMPLTGMLSTGLCKIVENVCMSEYLWVRMLAGYIATVIFLPMVAMGMHHGLVALYTVQLANIGYVTLYPALAMAGAGQVGAAVAIYLKCKKLGNDRMQRVIKGALPAGVLGVGEPLIYGVTLPLGRPFLTAGLGAGFGGAFLMAMQVASTTWGPSGVLAFFVMTAGPNPATMNMVYYGIGLLISYIMGYVLTRLFLKDEVLMPEDGESVVVEAKPNLNPEVDDGLSAKAERTESAFYNSQKENVAKGNKNMGKELVWLKKAGTIQKGEAVLTMLITKLNLPTPGREDGEETKLYSKADVQSKYAGDKKQDQYAAIAAALGGKHNIESLDCCATRLRLNVKDGSMLDEAALKANGAKAVLKDGNAVQIIFGPKVTVIKAKLQDYLEQCGDTVEVGNKVMPEAKAIVEKTVAMPAVKIAVEKTEAVAVAELPASDGPMEIITGQTVVGGIAVAKLHVAAKREEIVKRNADVKTELARLENTLEAVKADMEADAKTADTKSGEVLSAQLMMLEDDSFVKAVQANINEQKCCAEYAALLAGKSLAEEFKHMDSAYMQARSEDMEQIAQRVIDKLTGFNSKLELSEPVILVAEEFTPAQLAALDKNYVKGLVAHKGNASSHTAILAANYGLPYIFGIEPKQAYNGIGAIIDADNGKLALNPDEEYLALAKEKLETQAVMQSQSRASTKMEVYANISSAEDVEQALAKGADGVGLFRTEFLFMNRTSAPTEEEQYEVYKKVLEAMGDKPVIIRTIDIGTDKPAPYLHLPKEENPALGLRGVRVSLADKDLFSTQLKALLRASCYGNAHVMFPMITSVKEIMAIKEQIKLAEEELKAARVAYKLPKLGIMVETPAAAVWSEELAKHVDFFSIGTNDLTQYTLALDRQAEGMEVYYEPHHEAVLKLIEMTIVGGHKQCIPVGICGQLGGDVAVIPRLVQNGLDEVSVAIASIPKVRHAIIEAEKTIYVPDNTTIATSADELQLIAPVPGELVPMGDIPDATFAQGILGQCFGVKPSCGQICSPVNGVVMTVAATHHAVSIKADNGQEVLIHIGIDTVQLAGKGFNVQVKAGQRVAVGDALVETDLDTITAAGYNPMVITILLDTEGKAQEAEQETMVFEGTSFTHVVKDPVGIHARPAGEIVGLVKELNCNVQICCGEKTADGKSVIQLMKLGVAKGSELKIMAEGRDAGKALQLLQQYMQSRL